MKRFIRIFNICILFIVTLFTILTVVDVVEVSYKTKFNTDTIREHVQNIAKTIHSISDDEAHDEAYNYIIDEIESYGFVNEDSTSKLAYVVHDTKINFLTSNSLSEIVNGQSTDVPHTVYNESFDIKNIVVSIPGNSNKTNDAVMIMSHYDSVPMGPGASDDAVAVGVMLEAIRYYVEKIEAGYTFSNDLVFVFTDAEEYGLHGARVFIEEFNQLDNLLNRIKFAVNLESRGTSGTLIMFETSENNFNTVKLFSKINKNIFTSSIANMIYQSMPNGTDFSNYNDLYQGLNFANLGEGYNYHTQNDNYGNVRDTYLTQQAILIHDVLEETASFDLNSLYEANQDAIFFSYLNLGTIYYSNIVGYIFAIIAILLLVSIVYFSIKQSKKTLIKTLKGYLVIIASIFASAIVALILYYLFSFTASLFNVIDKHSIGDVNYSSVLLVICLAVISLTVTAITTHLLTKVLKIEGKDVRKSMSFFIAFIGILLSFALPVTSYLFIFIGIFLLTIELLSLVVKKIDTNKLHLNLLAAGLIAPIYMPMIFLSSDALGIDMSYAIAALLSIYSLVFIPLYLDSFKSVSVCRIKNCILKRNTPVKALYGMFSVLVIVIVFTFIVTSTKTNLSVNNLGKQNAKMLPYDDSLVYVVEGEESRFIFKDLNAYPYLKKDLDGYEYEKNINGYQKIDQEPTINLTNLSTYDLTNNVLTIDRATSVGFVEITFEGNKNITSITADFGHKTEEYMIIEDSNVLRIRHDAVVTFNTIDNNDIDVKISLYEVIFNYQPLKTYKDFSNITNIDNVKYNLIYATKLN